MKSTKSIRVLILIISIFSLTAIGFGIFTGSGPGERMFTTILGQVIAIYGKGIYVNNTVAAAMQAIPQERSFRIDRLCGTAFALQLSAISY